MSHDIFFLALTILIIGTMKFKSFKKKCFFKKKKKCPFKGGCSPTPLAQSTQKFTITNTNSTQPNKTINVTNENGEIIFKFENTSTASLPNGFTRKWTLVDTASLQKVAAVNMSPFKTYIEVEDLVRKIVRKIQIKMKKSGRIQQFKIPWFSNDSTDTNISANPNKTAAMKQVYRWSTKKYQLERVLNTACSIYPSPDIVITPAPQTIPQHGKCPKCRVTEIVGRCRQLSTKPLNFELDLDLKKVDLSEALTSAFVAILTKWKKKSKIPILPIPPILPSCDQTQQRLTQETSSFLNPLQYILPFIPNLQGNAEIDANHIAINNSEFSRPCLYHPQLEIPSGYACPYCLSNPKFSNVNMYQNQLTQANDLTEPSGLFQNNQPSAPAQPQQQPSVVVNIDTCTTANCSKCNHNKSPPAVQTTVPPLTQPMYPSYTTDSNPAMGYGFTDGINTNPYTYFSPFPHQQQQPGSCADVNSYCQAHTHSKCQHENQLQPIYEEQLPFQYPRQCYQECLNHSSEQQHNNCHNHVQQQATNYNQPCQSQIIPCTHERQSNGINNVQQRDGNSNPPKHSNTIIPDTSVDSTNIPVQVSIQSQTSVNPTTQLQAQSQIQVQASAPSEEGTSVSKSQIFGEQLVQQLAHQITLNLLSSSQLNKDINKNTKEGNKKIENQEENNIKERKSDWERERENEWEKEKARYRAREREWLREKERERERERDLHERQEKLDHAELIRLREMEFERNKTNRDNGKLKTQENSVKENSKYQKNKSYGSSHKVKFSNGSLSSSYASSVSSDSSAEYFSDAEDEAMVRELQRMRRSQSIKSRLKKQQKNNNNGSTRLNNHRADENRREGIRSEGGEFKGREIPRKFRTWNGSSCKLPSSAPTYYRTPMMEQQQQQYYNNHYPERIDREYFGSNMNSYEPTEIHGNEQPMYAEAY